MCIRDSPVGADDAPKTNNDLCLENAVIPIFSALGGLISIVVNLGTNISADKKFDKAIDYFNGNVKNRASIGIGINPNPMYLNLKYSQDGIGLVLNF